MLIPGQRVLLVEDLATDGKSKVKNINALREAGGKCDHCFVIFFYDIYPQAKKILRDLDVTLHALTTWKDVLAVAKASGKFDFEMLSEVEKFIGDPRAGRRLTSRGGSCGMKYHLHRHIFGVMRGLDARIHHDAPLVSAVLILIVAIHHGLPGQAQQ